MPVVPLLDQQVRLRTGRADVRHWAPDILPLLSEADPWGVDDFATHLLPLEDAARAYEVRREEAERCLPARPAAVRHAYRL